MLINKGSPVNTAEQTREIGLNVDDEEIRASDKLTALKMLWEAKGVVKKEKQTQITGAVFQGFDDKQLDVIEKPKKLKE